MSKKYFSILLITISLISTISCCHTNKTPPTITEIITTIRDTVYIKGEDIKKLESKRDSLFGEAFKLEKKINKIIKDKCE